MCRARHLAGRLGWLAGWQRCRARRRPPELELLQARVVPLLPRAAHDPEQCRRVVRGGDRPDGGRRQVAPGPAARAASCCWSIGRALQQVTGVLAQESQPPSVASVNVERCRARGDSERRLTRRMATRSAAAAAPRRPRPCRSCVHDRAARSAAGGAWGEVVGEVSLLGPAALRGRPRPRPACEAEGRTHTSFAVCSQPTNCQNFWHARLLGLLPQPKPTKEIMLKS